MSAPSLHRYIQARPNLHKWLMPLARWYKNAAGYRQLGLKYDDLFYAANSAY
jgi:ubiquinol-cytochrome c reductase subunit 7